MKERARSFRKNPTDAENRLWYFLRDRRLNGYKFVREYIIDIYIVDFVCRQKKIIIELDGSQHADTIKYDEKRTKFLEEKGYHVLRIWNDEVFTNIEGVLEAILNLLEAVMKKEKAGFSLFEILIVLVIISILTTLSFPLYSHYSIHANRLEAKIALVKLAHALEQHYTLQNTYKNVALQELGFSEFIAKNNYQLVLLSTSDFDFILQAKPLGNQALKDASCGILSLDAQGKKSISGTGTINACW